MHAGADAAMARQPAVPRPRHFISARFLYAHHVYDAAIELWERSAALDPDFATVQRNLGLAYMNQRGDGRGAQASYARAFALDPTDRRVFFELDQLDKKLGKLPAARLAQLATHQALVDKRRSDRGVCRTLQPRLGVMPKRWRSCWQAHLHPWEGGEGKVSGRYLTALMELAKTALARRETPLAPSNN